MNPVTKTIPFSGNGMNSSEKYIWTWHVREKMRYYRISESRIKRIIRHPVRVEEGIAPNTIAVMSPAEGKKYSEIWTMYSLIRNSPSSVRLSDRPASGPRSRARLRSSVLRQAQDGNRARLASQGPRKENSSLSKFGRRIKIITAWRYPGKSPARDPIPAEVLREIRGIL